MLPVVLALGCAVSWLLANVTIRPVAREHGPFRALVLAQVPGLAVAALAAFLLEGAPTAPADARSLGALAAAGVSALVAYSGLFSALDRGRLAVVAPIIASWSALAALAGFVLFGERLGVYEAVGVSAIFLGTLALARLERGAPAHHDGRRGGVGAALASSLGFGVMVTSVKILGETTGPAWAVAWTWSAELLLAFPLLAFRRRLLPLPSPRQWTLLARPGLCEVAGFTFMSLAVASGPVAIVAPVSNLATALSVAWGALVFRERLPLPAWLACLAVCAGVLLVAAS
ncbi:MAG: EamA family transporter [Planctomycetota bacterium]